MALPPLVSADIQSHLNAIAEHFANPKLTLVVRAPQLDDGDLVMTNDDPTSAIASIEKLTKRPAA